ncbi:transglycosylase domain-containing protein [Salinithrix halophila]|uniref:Transglycosylase domain-containing protein n=1 Tax=Salinithrix halophila TaxID=1485204 RepID=A0ABV8JDJ5_9BACL
MARLPSSNNHEFSRLRRFWRGLFRGVLLLSIVLPLLFLAGVGGLAGYFASLAKKEPVRSRSQFTQQLDNLSQTSHAFFRDGTPIGALRSEADRRMVRLDEISPHLIQAFLAAEDKDFYRHPGISPRGILRAARDNLSRQRVASGGSTITQQLVKNMVLQNREKVLERKLKEGLIALRLERVFTKDEILTFYLNSLYFGKGSHRRNMLGVEAASRGIFGRNTRHLTLAQSAYLAGMIQRPAAYDPYRSDTFAAGKRRMKTVLNRMLKNGQITPATYEEALASNLEDTLVKPHRESAYHRHPFLMAAVEEEAAKRLMDADGLNPSELSAQGLYRTTLEQYRKRILTGGLRVETTLDNRLDAAVNKTAANPHLFAKPITYTVRYGSKNHVVKNAPEEVGAVLLDVKTGGILAFVGGRNFETAQTNHALSARRQPGSTIKPLLDYGPALDQGMITPGTVLVDEPLTVKIGNGETKTYKNQNEAYQGPVTARHALKWSLNIPSIKLLRKLGKKEAFRYLEAMDFPIHPRDGEASAIGGFTRGFTVAEMVGGYAMLARGGIWEPPHLVEKITDGKGRVLYEHRPSPKRILSPEGAFLTVDMLRDVIKSGTGRRVGSRMPGYDLAGKTGTTQNGHDLWFIGTTPQVALGVWIGYDINHPLPDSRRAKDVWSRLFRSTLRTRPELFPKGEAFLPPETLEQVELCTVSGQKATENCRKAGEGKTDWVRKGEEPEDLCSLHAVADIVHGGDKDYLADSRTPADFVLQQSGVQFPPDSSEARWYPGKQLPTETDPRESQGIPDPPRVFATPAPDGIRLTWFHSGKESLVGFRIYRDGSHIQSIPSGQPTRWNGPPGNYAVTAVDVAGLESKQAVPPAMTPLPSTPAGLTVSHSAGVTQLSWHDVVGTDQYRIYSASKPDGPYQLIGQSSRPTAAFSTGDSNRWYRVTSVNPQGESPPSKPAS